MSTDFGEALSAGMQLGCGHSADTHDYVLVPDHTRVEDLEKFKDAPRRIRQRVRAETLESFAAYIAKFKEPSSVLFASVGAACIARCVLDYHESRDGGDHNPRWGEHAVNFSPPNSVEWNAWVTAHDKEWQQADFARFLRARQMDVTEPDGATLLEVARDLLASKNLVFRSGVSLKDGSVQFQYEEEVKAGRGQLVVPEAFMIQVPFHRGGPLIPVKVWLSYAIKERGLTFRYEIENLPLVTQYAQESWLQALRTATGMVPFVGAASGPE